ncbi:MAG: Lrp/AsnC ligand binding domain-containing protein [Alphaproteobacteria bacterium]|nr:Lrp/AsnC ligand binding domain-containing protein [Alphaproteobacteria bacterium]
MSLDRHDAEVLEVRPGDGRDSEVLEVYLMAGDYDYFVKIASQWDAKGVGVPARTRLFKVAGLRHSKSSFSLRCLKKVTCPSSRTEPSRRPSAHA